ncbi:MAG: hypothetical protein ACM3QS_02410 [Bacteroidota bacterium]
MLNIRTVTLSAVVVLVLALAAFPVLAAAGTFGAQPEGTSAACGSGRASPVLGVEGGLLSLLTRRAGADVGPAAGIVESRASQTLGVEGGVLSMLNRRAGSSAEPVAAIIESGAYSVRSVPGAQSTNTSHVQSGCLPQMGFRSSGD